MRNKKPKFQTVFNLLLYTIGGIVFISTILSGIDNSIELLGSNNSTIWTTILICIWLYIYFYLKLKRPIWVLKNHKMRISKPNKQINLFFLGMIFLVWIPCFIRSDDLKIQILYPYQNMETLGTFEMKWVPDIPGIVSIKNSLDQTIFSSHNNAKSPFRIDSLVSGEDYQLILNIKNSQETINVSIIEDPRGQKIHEAEIIIKNNATHVVEGLLILPFLSSLYLEIYLNNSLFKTISGQALKKPHKSGPYCYYTIAKESISKNLVDLNYNINMSVNGYVVNQKGEVFKLKGKYTLSWNKYEEDDYHFTSFDIRIYYTIDGNCNLEISNIQG